MTIYKGASEALPGDLYIGSTEIQSVYVGSTSVWENRRPDFNTAKTAQRINGLADYPSSLVDDEIAVLILVTRSSSAPGTPSGWSELNVSSYLDTGSFRLYVGVYFKSVSASDSDSSFNTNWGTSTSALMLVGSQVNVSSAAANDETISGSDGVPSNVVVNHENENPVLVIGVKAGVDITTPELTASPDLASSESISGSVDTIVKWESFAAKQGTPTTLSTTNQNGTGGTLLYGCYLTFG